MKTRVRRLSMLLMTRHSGRPTPSGGGEGHHGHALVLHASGAHQEDRTHGMTMCYTHDDQARSQEPLSFFGHDLLMTDSG